MEESEPPDDTEPDLDDLDDCDDPTEDASRPPSRTWRLIRSLAWLVVAALALALSVFVHLDRPVAREATRLATNTLVSPLMRGRLEIGRIDALHLYEIVARDVTLYDAEGRAVIRGDRIDLVPDLGAAMRGVLRFSHARLQNGELILIEGESGLPTFIEAFQSPDDAPSVGPPFHAIVDDMHLEDVTIHGDLLGVEGLRIEEARAHGRMDFEGRTLIEIFDVNGRLVAPWPFEARIESVYARIDSTPHAGTELHARVGMEGEQAGAILFYRVPEGEPDDAPPELDLLLGLDPVRAERLHELGFDWAEPLRGEVRGNVRFQGLPEDLSIDAWLHTEGGDVGVRGRLPSEGETDVMVRSDALRIAELIVGAPELTLAGEGRLRIVGEDTFLELDTDAFELDGLPIPALQLRGRLRGDGVELQDTRVLAGGDVLVSGRVGFDGSIDLEVAATIPQLAGDALLEAIVPGARGSGTFHGRVAISSEGDLDVSGRWVFRDLHYGPVRLGRLVATGSVDGSTSAPVVHLDLDASALFVSEMSFGDGGGRIDGGPSRFTTRGDFTHPEHRVNFEALLERRGELLHARVPTFVLGGHGQRWAGSFEDLVIGSRQVALGRGEFVNDTQRLVASGHWHFGVRTEDSFTVETEGVVLRDVTAWIPGAPDIRGTVDGEARIQGDFEGQPSVEIDAQVDALAVDAIGGFDAAILARYLPGEDIGVLDLDAQLTHPERGALDLRLTGQVDASIPLADAWRDGAYEATFGARELDMSLANELASGLPALVGRGTGEIVVSGSLDVFDFRGHLDSSSLSIGEFPPLTVRTTVSFRDGVLIGRAVTLDAAGEFVEVEASTLLDLTSAIEDPSLLAPMLEAAPWRAAMRMPPRDLGLLPEPLRVLIPGAESLRAAASVTMRGGAFEPRADLIADLEWIAGFDEVRCGADAAPRLSIRGKLRGSEIRVEAQGMVADEHVLALELVAPSPINAWIADPSNIQLPPMRLEAHAEAAPIQDVPYACEYASGPVDMHLVADGLFSTDPHLSLEVTGEAIQAQRLELVGAGDGRRLVIAEQSPPFSLALSTRMQHGSLTTDLQADWWNGGATSVQASLDVGEEPVPTFDANAMLDATVVLEGTPLQAVLLWLPGFGEVDGIASGEVSARGPLDEAVLAGAIDLTHGQVELESLGQRLDDVAGTLLFEGDRITLQGLTARDSDGVARIAGDVTMTGVFPSAIDLELETDEFPVRQEGSIIASLTGHAGLAAEIGGNAMTGELDVHELQVRLPDSLGRSPIELAHHPEILVIGEGPAERAGDPYELRLHVDARRPFGLKGQDLAAEVSAELDVLYRAPDFRVDGGVELRSGHFDVFGKRFEVEGGWLRFDGTEELDPLVNLVAVHELRARPGETVTVTASGRLSSPQIRFASSLTTDRAQIIALLVSGNVRQDSELEASRQAADFLAGIASGVLTLSLREEFGSYFPAIAVESNSLGGTRIRSGINFEDLLPEVIREIVQGAYFEGFLNTAGQQGTQSTGQVQDVGVRLELDFPRGVQNSYTFGGPSSWSIDVTWQP